MNLGSPDSTEVKDVRNYLKEFLMDKRVIDSPYLLRTILVKGLITPFRAPKSAEAYESIWTEEGSPLVAITRKLKEAVQQEIDEPVEIAMRDGSPNIKAAYETMMSKHPGITEVVLVPMYPHYAMSSYETAVVQAKEVHKKGNYPFSISIVPPFYNDPAYIHALTESIRPYWEGSKGHLLFSYHSIPERHIMKSDPTGKHCLKSPDCCEVPSPCHKFCYRHQCFVTTKLVVAALGIPADRYSVSFQSKLGRSEWLKPATTARMEQMPKEGIKDLMVVCPAFVSDCLETLEEIAIREKENFMNAGGEHYVYIPCMNVQPNWVKAVTTLVNNTHAKVAVV
jgi:ferrochelatase